MFDNFILIIKILGLITNVVISQHNPYFMKNRNGIVELFEWKFNAVANECVNFLGPKGFAAVQVSPITENLIVRESRPWWERYQPISYKIQTRSGTENEFQAMVKTCFEAQIRIYVDVVINHMAANRNANEMEELIGTANSTAYSSIPEYSEVPYSKEEFHTECMISSEEYGSIQEIRNCRLDGSPDLDHSKETVKIKIIDFFNKLIDFGVGGFHVMNAKNIWPNDLKDIYGRVKNLNKEFNFPEDSKPFFYQDVIDLEHDGGFISKAEYNGNGVVSEYMHSIEIAKVFNGQKTLSELINWGPSIGFLPYKDSLIFIDNHQLQRNNKETFLNYKNIKKYEMAAAFMLAHPYGIKRLMSSYKFQSNDEGPPINSENDDEILSPEFNDNNQCSDNSSWVCEHRWNSISNMIEFSNIVQGESINNWQNNGLDQIAFCLGQKGFIAFNNYNNLDFNLNVTACLKSGKYCDIISGSIQDNNQCSGKIIIIDENHTTNISIPINSEHGVIAVHINSQIK